MVLPEVFIFLIDKLTWEVNSSRLKELEINLRKPAYGRSMDCLLKSSRKNEKSSHKPMHDGSDSKVLL